MCTNHKIHGHCVCYRLYCALFASSGHKPTTDKPAWINQEIKSKRCNYFPESGCRNLPPRLWVKLYSRGASDTAPLRTPTLWDARPSPNIGTHSIVCSKICFPIQQFVASYHHCESLADKIPCSPHCTISDIYILNHSNTNKQINHDTTCIHHDPFPCIHHDSFSNIL